MKLELFTTLQEQPAAATTLKPPDPALELKLELFVLNAYVQLPDGVKVIEKFSEPPPKVAVIIAVVFVVTDEVLTVKVLLDKPVPMLTEAGTVACEALLDRLIVVALRASLLRATVHFDVAGGVTLVGLQFKLEITGADG
jgi:hypothetical protein